MIKSVPRRVVTAVALATVAAGIASCGSSTSSSTSASTTASGSSTNAARPLSSFVQELTAAEAPVTSIQSAPSPPIAKNKTIAVILASAAAPGIVRQADGAKAAAKALGWQVIEYDGMGLPSVERGDMLQAIARKVNGIFITAIDSKTLGSAISQARAAGIPVVSAIAKNVVGNTGTDVYAEPGDPEVTSGENTAAWIVANSHGTAHIAMFHTPAYTSTNDRWLGAKKVFAECPGCKIVADKVYSPATAVTDIPQLTKSVLTANPDINYVWADIGGYGTVAVTAMDQLGVRNKVIEASFDCNLPDLQNIHSGNIQQVCEGIALEEGSWGVMDELNRAFNHAPPAPDVISTRLITKANLNPVWLKTGYTGDIDYQAAWKKLWGIS